MSKNPTLNGLVIVASLVAAAGVVLTITSISDASLRVQRMRDKAGQIRTLRHYEEASRSRRAQQAAVDEFRARPGASLPALAGELIPDATAEVRERDAVPAMAGWVLRQADVTFSELPLQHVGGFIEAAEGGRPPWKLTSCTMRASPQTPGRGHVTLSFELLQPN